jgi:hypothetical protein
VHAALSIAILLAALILLTAVGAGLAACAGYLVGAFVARWQLASRAATVRTAVALLVFASTALGTIIAVGTIANLEAASKAHMLARALVELATCTVWAAPVLALLAGGGVWATWRLTRPPRSAL